MKGTGSNFPQTAFLPSNKINLFDNFLLTSFALSECTAIYDALMIIITDTRHRSFMLNTTEYWLADVGK